MSVLGRTAPVPERYAPQVLDPIPRQAARDGLGLRPGLHQGSLPFVGEDVWHGWELSWLEGGVPRVGVLRLAVPCDSPNLVESKSLKLYLNSLNHENLAGPGDLCQRIEGDLADAAGAAVAVELLAPDDASLAPVVPAGECIDGLQPSVLQSGVLQHQARAGAPEPGLLQCRPGRGRQRLYSHALRSLCPVTAQPDWATVLVEVEGAAVEPASLLAYIASFRRHQQFHEHCVERMFTDLWQACAPADLSVHALFTRRGGLDINPYRSASQPRAPRLRMHRQ